jgi:hypothetical protein
MRLRDVLARRRFVIETSWTPGVAAVELRKRIEGPSMLGRDDAPGALATAVIRIRFACETRDAERALRAILASAPALPAPPDTGKAYR